MGGLAAAIRLAAAGRPVTLIEARDGPGGKMRTVASAAGPVDAGPTVLTMRGVFDGLFAAAGESLDDHLTLSTEPLLARHWWPDGTTLDLFADREASAAAVRAFGGASAEDDFRRFSARAADLHAAFDAPVMRAPRPDPWGIARAALARPAIWPWLLPGRTLERMLARSFRDPRLAQLFGRYATYVGGQPALSPAVLALIWRAEEEGVWSVAGGMHGLAQALAALAARLGVVTHWKTRAERIDTEGGAVSAVVAGGTRIPAGTVVFNGDPAALLHGLLGQAATRALPAEAVRPRSHSAWVWSFAARSAGLPLALHNVLFSADRAREYAPLATGAQQTAPSLYVCAQDRSEANSPAGPERFEIIVNAPPSQATAAQPTRKEYETCRMTTFATLERMGLTFDPLPDPAALTGPAQFARMFPGSEGSIYGLSPHGTFAAFSRPGPATRLPGLWIAGGGAHPGAGVPMAALSGIHAADAILARPASMSRSARTATPGGMSTASRTTKTAPSRS
jgi:1-hydroxycarotenoid 3,4-desaturase